MKSEMPKNSEGAVTVRLAECGKCIEIQNDIVRISKDRIRFNLPVRVSLGSSVALELADVELKATIHWVGPARESRWPVLCLLDRELSRDALERLAANGFVERRRHPRIVTSLHTMAQWELDETSVPVELKDLSPGGFCILCSECFSDRRQLRLTFFDVMTCEETTCTARCIWHRQVESGHLHGCEFIDPSASLRIAEITASEVS